MAPDIRSRTRGTEPDRERSLGVLLREIGGDAGRLLRQEIALARAEFKEMASRMAGAAAKLAVGLGLASVGGLTLVAFLVILLGGLIGSYWLAALLVAVVFLAAGGLIAWRGGRSLQSIDTTPRASVASLQATSEWARNEASEVSARLAGRGDRPGRASIPAAATATDRYRGGVALSRPATAPPARAPDRGTAPVAPATAQPAERKSAVREPPPEAAGKVAFLKHVFEEIKEDEVPGHAAKLAYYAFMAMPPALMALFGLAGLVGNVGFAAWLQSQAAIALPVAVSEGIIGPFIEQVVLEKAPGPFSVGLILALWGGSSIFLGLMDTLNHAFDVAETRSFFQKRATAVAIMFGSLLLFLVAAGTLLAGPLIVDAIGLGPAGEQAWSILQWPLAFAFMVGVFWCAYYFLPDRNQSACKRVLLQGAALAAALWVLATGAFRLYIANFSSYSETYGFLGAFIILLLWLYVTGLVVLAGGELASEMEKRAR